MIGAKICFITVVVLNNPMLNPTMPRLTPICTTRFASCVLAVV